jgi:hypothetical protein
MASTASRISSTSACERWISPAFVFSTVRVAFLCDCLIQNGSASIRAGRTRIREAG